MKQYLACLFFCCTLSPLLAQKKQLDHADIHRWRKIEQPRISNDGEWTAYGLVPVTEGDATLALWNARTDKTILFPRATEARFSEDNKLLIFRIKPPLDTLKAQRRRKVKEEDLPKDTLGIYTIPNGHLEKIPRLKTFAMPEKWSGYLAYQLDPEKPVPAKKDTSAAATPVKKTGGKKSKKEDKDNGYRLFVRNTESGKQDTFAYVQNFAMAKRGKRILLNSSGKGDTLVFPVDARVLQNGVYLLDLEKNSLLTLFRGKGKYQQLTLDEAGAQAAFLVDTDTTKARIRPWQLCYWPGGLRDSAQIIANPQSNFLVKFDSRNVQASGTSNPQSTAYQLSEHYRPVFSEDGEKLYFGIAPPPVLNDTLLLPEEVVNVEVWAWTDGRLYTEQENRLDADKKLAYPAVWHIRQNRFVPLGSPDVPEIRFQEQRNAPLALGFSEEPYTQYITSEGVAHKDLYSIDLKNGDKKRIVTDLRCNPRLSPEARYIAWWSDPDTAWYAWNARAGVIARLSDNRSAAFYNEENDVPDYPNEHGLAGWFERDEAVLLYDRFDIWKMDPNGKDAPQRLTRGRETQTTYRYLKLDPEERSISPKARLLLHQFNEQTKTEGYAWLDLPTGRISSWFKGDFAYSRQPLKAKNSDAMLFTRENFQVFPDLLYTAYSNSDSDAGAWRRVSNANPQQSEYRWGTIEPVSWTSLSGEMLQGMLVKPEDYDPGRKYPMIVNFYERQSDEINRHRAPDFGRSQISFVFYASRGYLVFVPDIPYRTGYPGECAYDAVVSGVTSLMNKGLADPKKIAIQGHSWGGYQAAYLVTRTNLFACAEAGAPVSNMTSAYGGIRWESGRSRAFQYEHQQSRIGGTLWEFPMRYLENSPLFALDKVQTPLLVLHNDKDGAVPWEQGVELFSGLRRLGKPAWMLNYNDEPHWPVKLQNRIDFQNRMQQFFDFYLLGAPQPRWMQRGVPPMEKGILQGMEVMGGRQ